MRWFIITDEIIENVKQKEKQEEEKPKNLRYLIISKL